VKIAATAAGAARAGAAATGWGVAADGGGGADAAHAVRRTSTDAQENISKIAAGGPDVSMGEGDCKGWRCPRCQVDKRGVRPTLKRCCWRWPTVVTELALALAALALAAPAARAQAGDGRRPVDEEWPVRSTGKTAVDAGLLLALPAQLQTGLSSGLGAGVTRGGRFAWGVRGSWSSATESSLTWTVAHNDFRLRGVAALQQPAGRGVFALRLGVGPTFVYEHRERNQGARAGLTGSDLETSALAVFPGAEVEGVVKLHILGRWLLTLSGGPSVLVADGSLRYGWTAQLGAGWQP
jgi:hypothetical protein